MAKEGEATEEEFNRMMKPVAEYCTTCKKEITFWDTKVMSDKLKYHDRCFTCSECGDKIQVSTHFKAHSVLFCGTCYFAKKAPKCEKCGKAIEKEGTAISTPDRKVYHKECFKCHKCNEPISAGFKMAANGRAEHYDCNKVGGELQCVDCNRKLHKTKFFTLADGGKVCVGCYEANHCKTCFTCLKPITQGSSNSVKDMAFHTGCFVCDKCGASLVGQRIKMHTGKLVCFECPPPLPPTANSTERKKSDSTGGKEASKKLKGNTPAPNEKTCQTDPWIPTEDEIRMMKARMEDSQ